MIKIKKFSTLIYAQSKTAHGEGQEAPETSGRREALLRDCMAILLGGYQEEPQTERGQSLLAVRFEMHPALRKVVAPD